MNRRGLLGAALAAAVAPAFVRAGVIMRPAPRQILRPDGYVLWGDGAHDDTVALQALFDGSKDVRHVEFGPMRRPELWCGEYRVSKTIHIRKDGVSIANSSFSYQGGTLFDVTGNGCELRGLRFDDVSGPGPYFDSVPIFLRDSAEGACIYLTN